MCCARANRVCARNSKLANHRRPAAKRLLGDIEALFLNDRFQVTDARFQDSLFRPPVFLNPDVVPLDIDGFGALENPILE